MDRRAARRCLVGLVAVAVFVEVVHAANAATTAEAWRRMLAARATGLSAAGQSAVRGRDGFLFLTSELHSYAQGPFWGKSAAKASVAEKNQDPLTAIVDFHRQLKQAGVQLILVPVPGKVVTYPDKLEAAVTPNAGLDAAHRDFYALLRKQGIVVIDLLPEMLALRRKGTAVHCQQDSHWTPAVVALAARKLRREIARQPWYARHSKRKYHATRETIHTGGDIAAMLGAEGAPEETLTIEHVALNGEPAGSDRASPVVLMGDSHSLVYHQPIAGGIQASDAGLFDHLAKELGFAPDLVGVLGSGANASRLTLARRKDNLAGKKVVIWCFAAREFTESSQGWVLVPVVRRRRRRRRRACRGTRSTVCSLACSPLRRCSCRWRRSASRG